MKSRKYYRIFFAMTRIEALKTLGFKSTADPTKPEIISAYRAKAFAAHPDRGGSHDKMVKINVAKDILLGKTAPDYDYARKPRDPDAWKKYRPVYTVEHTFDDALKEIGGLPSGVTWHFFIASSYYTYYFGTKGSKMYILSVGQRTERHPAKDDPYPDAFYEEKYYDVNLYEDTLPRKAPTPKQFKSLLQSVAKVMGANGIYIPTKVNMLPDGWRPKETLPRTQAVPLGNILRKIYGIQKEKKIPKIMFEYNPRDDSYMLIFNDFKKYTMTEKEADRFKPFMWDIFGSSMYAFDRSVKKTITRMKPVIRAYALDILLKKVLVSAPSWVKDYLKAAHAKYMI